MALIILISSYLSQFIAINQRLMEKLQESFIKKARYRSKLFIFLMTCNIALSSFYFGYHNNCFSTLRIETMINIFSIPLLPSTASGVINGVIPLASILGAVLTYYFVTKISRRKIILYTNCFAFLAGLIILIENFYFLLLARFLQGMCIGSYITMSPMIIRELAPTQIAGVIGAIPQIFMTFGVTFACVFQYALSQIYDDPQTKVIWIYVLGFPLIILAIQTIVLLFVFPYETPKYLISVGDKKGAKQLIAVLYIDEYCEEIQMEKVEDFKAKIKHDQEISQLDNQIYGGHSIWLKFKSNASIFAFIIAIAQQLSGVNPVSLYGYEIVKKSIQSIRALVPSIINGIQLLGCLKASYLLYKFGRKDLFIYGSLGMSISLFFVFIGLKLQDAFNQIGTFLAIFGLGLFSLVFGMTIGPCTWLYISEIIDPELMPYTAAANRFSAVLSIAFFPIITASLLNGDSSILFLFFSLILLFFSSFFKKYLIQTKGKQEKQLRMQFKSLRFLN